MASERRRRPRVASLRPAPAIGWVMISRTEVAKAESLLLGEDEGVVDELGLLAIHQAIADRLFPGTSVLHTRLRYALFVPWLMQLAAHDRNPADSLRTLEFRLTGQLLKGTGKDEAGRRGIIGARVYQHRKHAAQPPSYSYWTALSTWGILGRQYIRAHPSREAVLDELDELAKTGSAVDMDGLPAWGATTLFDGLPALPDGLLDGPQGATFKLSGPEKSYLMRRLSALKVPDQERECLFAALAREPIALTSDKLFWANAQVRARAGTEDRRVLELAKSISALGGIARAVYLAMVEQACADKNMGVQRRHRDHLEACRKTWGEEALQADLDAVVEHGLGLKTGELFDLLALTQGWLRKRGGLAGLREIYRSVEVQRKTSRARLAGTRGATAKLREWARSSDQSRRAERLHFRWPQVVSLIGDLHAR